MHVANFQKHISLSVCWVALFINAVFSPVSLSSDVNDESASAWSTVCPHRYKSDIVGSCYHPNQREPTYCEYHLLNASFVPSGNLQADDNVSVATKNVTSVIYTTLTGNVIAQKVIDYNQSQFRPETRQTDIRFGEVRSAKTSINDDKYWLVGYQESSTDAYKEKRLERQDIDVNDAGFDNFVRVNWDALLSGDSITFNFLSIPHKRTLELTAKKISADRCVSSHFDASGNRPSGMKGLETDTQLSQVCIGVSVSNILLKLIASSLSLSYDIESQRLIRFSGAVNILDDKEQTQSCDLGYRYF